NETAHKLQRISRTHDTPWCASVRKSQGARIMGMWRHEFTNAFLLKHNVRWTQATAEGLVARTNPIYTSFRHASKGSGYLQIQAMIDLHLCCHNLAPFLDDVIIDRVPARSGFRGLHHRVNYHCVITTTYTLPAGSLPEHHDTRKHQQHPA